MTPTVLPDFAGTGSVTSADGALIGYRQVGHGPGLVLVHGSLMASRSFTKLAFALSDRFTVYVPDRRGRGLSGSFGADYGIQKEVEDLHAVLAATGAHYVFGLSSGAIISLQSALELPDIHRVALYEPPLSFPESSSVSWVPAYERELARGKLGAALVAVMKGTSDSGLACMQ